MLLGCKISFVKIFKFKCDLDSQMGEIVVGNFEGKFMLGKLLSSIIYSNYLTFAEVQFASRDLTKCFKSGQGSRV